MLATEPHPYIWTTRAYKTLVELGVFADRRVELIEGVIVEISPMGSKHETAMVLTMERLRQAFGPGYYARPQLTLDLSPHSMPEPDVAVVPGGVRDYADKQPTTALLIVEVSDSTLKFDRGEKASLYARAGIADYWILNLVNQRLEVYRGPVEDQRARYGYHYHSVLNLGPEDEIAPLALPEATIPVRDLLP
jgi:Uma2 family endonuclease